MGIDISKKFANCPVCGFRSKRHSFGNRTIIDLNKKISVRYSKHNCLNCQKFFSLQPNMVRKNGRYSNNVINMVIGLCKKMDPESIRDYMIKNYNIKIARSVIDDWIIDHKIIARSPIRTDFSNMGKDLDAPMKEKTKQRRLNILKARHTKIMGGNT